MTMMIIVFNIAVLAAYFIGMGVGCLMERSKNYEVKKEY